MGRGRGTILGSFCEHLYNFFHNNMKIILFSFPFVLPRGSFVLPSWGWGGGGGSLGDDFYSCLNKNMKIMLKKNHFFASWQFCFN